MTLGLIPRYGWKADWRIHEGTAERFAFGAPPPAECLALERHLDAAPGVFPFDQGVTSTCVPHAAKAAIYVRAREQGFGDVLASIVGIYTTARRIESPYPAPLVDAGLYPRDAIDAMGKHGVFAERMGGFNPKQVNDDLYLDEIARAATHRVSAWRRIADLTNEISNAGIIDEMKRSIVAGFGFIFGADLDFPYERYKRGVYERDPNADSAGRHMQYCYGYTAEGALVLNSWGAGWGDRGRAVIGWSTMASRYVSDRYRLEVAPCV